MNESTNKAVWPEWETVREIGKGSFGAVYEIQKDVFGMTDKAALKVITIPKEKSDIEDLYSEGYDASSITARYKNFLEEIVREYQLMAELKGNHNIVYCDDLRYIQHDDGFGWDIYIKMELLIPLIKGIQFPVEEQQVIKLGMDICNALIACEKKNIIHRDIKPQNIFMSEEGDFKLGDFGIAKTAEHVATGTKTGTFKYMAPEVYNNQPYGNACDLYSLGLVLYWMLNERRGPFLPLPPTVPTATEDNEALVRRMSGDAVPAPINGSDALKRIVLKACEPNPALRFASAREMYEALAEVTDGPEESGLGFFTDINDTCEDIEEENDETIGMFGRSSNNAAKQEESVRIVEENHQEEKQKVRMSSFGKIEEVTFDSVEEMVNSEAFKGFFGNKQKQSSEELELAISPSQMTLGCEVEYMIPSTGERIMVKVPAGKKTGTTMTVSSPKSGNLTLKLKTFYYQKDEHKKNTWEKKSDAELWAYATGCGAPSGIGGRIGLAILVFVLFCTAGAFFVPIGFVGFGVTAWVLVKPSDRKKNMNVARMEWNKRYPNAKF